MSCLILIAGLPATGKTTFAEYLSQKIKVPWFSKDVLKEHLFDTVGFKNRKEKNVLGIASMSILYYAAESHLKAGRHVILENNFEERSKPGLLKLIDTYRCKTITVKFHTDRDVLEKRFLARDKSPGRHRGHVINTQYPETDAQQDHTGIPDPADYWINMKQRGMDNFSVGGREILVDTTDFSKVSYDDLCEEISAFIAGHT